MIRLFHRWPGLVALALVTLLALSGAALSVFPAAERFQAPPEAAGQSVADLAARIAGAHPGVEQIRRQASGRIIADWTENDQTVAMIIDPATGDGVSAFAPNATERWLADLHRSLFLGDGGRIVMAAGALAMLLLALTGVVMVARRNGGWRRWLAPSRGPLASRLHVEIARIAAAGLILSSVTALWMTASTFGLLPDRPALIDVPASSSGETGMAVSAIDILRLTPVSDLRELTFPYPGDTADVFTLKTTAGMGYIDQGTGAVLAWRDLTPWERTSDTIAMLHTGRGAATLGLVLGLLALGVPVMGVTGLIQWRAGRRTTVKITGNARAAKADTIILVGSEGGSTWRFASALHKALSDAGHAVHAAPLSAFDPQAYHRAERVIVMAATYGAGDAPASARGFLERLERLDRAPALPLAVLGFGDSGFPRFCGFAQAIAAAADRLGWQHLLPMGTVDRQSPQDFARWGEALGRALGLPLTLDVQPVAPRTVPLTLLSRRDYGAEVQAPQAILRFALPRRSLRDRLTGRGLGGFVAGDLLGIVPEGSDVPRFYSLASGAKDGFIEIAVSKHPGGLCSGQLTALMPGETVNAFLRPNPSFRLARGTAPVILIGAGTGVGPLAGFIRANSALRPMHLYFGFRHAQSDCLFDRELAEWLEQGQLDKLVIATSRGRRPHYVQDALRLNGQDVARLIHGGARIMVCGSRDMARGVAQALADILRPLGLTPEMLKLEGRYAEDCY